MICLPVSHICALTVPPSSLIVLVANSTPIVGPFFLGISLLIYLLRRDVLPTPASPIRITIQKYMLESFQSEWMDRGGGSYGWNGRERGKVWWRYQFTLKQVIIVIVMSNAVHRDLLI